jgi:S1-C subfamily serine protease
VRLLLGVGATVLAGIIAFLVTVNRTEVPGSAPVATRPPAVRVVVPSPTMSLDDLARAQLSRTVTIEALGSTDEGLGTGWLLDAKGDFVTNAHVVQGQLAVRIRGRDGSSHVGDVLGIDRDLDIAVIRSRDGFAGTPLTTFAVWSPISHRRWSPSPAGTPPATPTSPTSGWSASTPTCR